MQLISVPPTFVLKSSKTRQAIEVFSQRAIFFFFWYILDKKYRAFNTQKGKTGPTNVGDGVFEENAGLPTLNVEKIFGVHMCTSKSLHDKSVA